MGYQRAHHKKKGKEEASQIAHIKPFFQVKGKPALVFIDEEFYFNPKHMRVMLSIIKDRQ